jgi:catechol 2,3-dioxygenase-like lactoylglutathione lyase family enzyme
MTDKYPIPYKNDQVYFQYNVKNFDRARKFYGEILGLENTWDGGEEAGWMEYALPVSGARVGLNFQREGEIKHGSGTLTFVVEDLVVTKKYFESKSIESDDIVDIPDMISYFNIKDYDDNPIQVVADPRVKSE